MSRLGCVAVAGAHDDRIATLRRTVPSSAPVPLAVSNGVSTVSARAVTMASTRGDMYVASHDSDAVASFKPWGGSCLTFASTVYADSDPGLDGLRGIQHLALSPDERHLYTAAEIDDAVVVFSRDTAMGDLTFVQTIFDGAGVDGLDGARALAVSPDGVQVYVASQVDSALAVFSRDPGTGQLTQVGLHRDGVDGVDGLATADGLAVSHDGVQVFVSGFGDDSLATFTRTSRVILVDGFESGDTTAWSAVVL